MCSVLLHSHTTCKVVMKSCGDILVDNPNSVWWVYVIQSLVERRGKRGNPLPGFYYVGSTTDPTRRIRQHNGLKKGGGKYTFKARPWVPRALYGPYCNRSEALRAEMALKHNKRGVERIKWSINDHHLCRGLGPDDPWVTSSKP